MFITGIEALPQKKNKVFIDGDYAFMLYDRDLRMYHLEEDSELTPEQYDRIIRETVLRRANQKAMALLERMDRTEADLRRKLKDGLYTEDIIDSVIALLTKLHYLDDVRFAENFIRSHSSSMSNRELTTKLLQKGVSKENITSALSTIDEERSFKWESSTGFSSDCIPDSSALSDDSLSREQAAAVSALKKKLNGRTSIDYKTRQKVIGFMLRKGYRMADINMAFDTLNITFEASEDPDSTTSFFDLSDNF